jgi:hypothetical protein
MAKKSYIEIIKYPLVTWLVFYIVAFIFGFTNYVGVSTEVMFGNATLFLALLFGLWVGKRSTKAFGYLWVSMLSAFMLVVIIGVIGVVLGLALASFSGSFMGYLSQYGSQGALLGIVLNATITTWVEMAMVAMVAAAATYEFSSKN